MGSYPSGLYRTASHHDRPRRTPSRGILPAVSSRETSPWTVPMARVEDVLARPEVRVVDLRSPVEFTEDHLPGAKNIPLFDDVERALVGTLYKRTSPEAAFEEGRRITFGRIESLVEELATVAGRDPVGEDLAQRVREMTEGGIEKVNRSLESVPVATLSEDAVVVLCWRGGLRSSSVVALLRALGWSEVVGLDGGYRAYRRAVRSELEAWPAQPAFVLRGSTGVGKTLILREIERIRPGWTVDLEGLAGHRSSILGMVGLSPCSQKTFDSRMAARLRQGLHGLVIFEGESRKVGDAIIPDSVWRALDRGVNIFLEATMDRRIDVLTEDYLATDESRAQLRRQLPFIENRLGSKKWKGELVRRLDTGEERELVAILLELYYDPLYHNSEKERKYAVKLDASDIGQVAGEVIEWIEKTRSEEP
jgi:tRNA 2-selenouridine synthase